MARPFSIKEIARPVAAAAADADVWSELDVPRTLSRENFAASVPNPPTSLQVSQKTSPELELRGFLSIARYKAWSHIVIFCYLHLAICKVQVLSTKSPVCKGRLLFADECRIQHPRATKKRRRTKR